MPDRPQTPTISQGQLQRLPLAAISADRSLVYRDPLERWEGAPALRQSLARAGQLQPVTLREQGETLQLTAGFRRVQALGELGAQELWARVSGAPAAVLFAQAVEGHAGQPANLRERIRALAIGRELGLEGAVLCQLLAALGQPAQAHLVEQHLRLAALPPPLLDLLVSKSFSLRRCLPFCQLATEEGELLARLALALRLGGRQIEELGTALREIAAREGVSLAQVVRELELLPAPEQDQGRSEGGRTETAALLERVARRRLPETFRRRDELGQLCAAFGVGQLRVDPALADEAVELTVRLEDPAALRPLAETLASEQTARRLAQILAKL